MQADDRAEELLRLAQKAAGDLVQALNSLGLLASPKKEAERILVREQARYLFLFVLLSALLEEGANNPADKAAADALKALFAQQLVETRKQAEQLLGKALKPGRAELLRQKIADSHGDPFAPYYGSWERFKKDPGGQGPFMIFAATASELHFEPAERSRAKESLISLAMTFSDELLDLTFSS